LATIFSLLFNREAKGLAFALLPFGENGMGKGQAESPALARASGCKPPHGGWLFSLWETKGQRPWLFPSQKKTQPRTRLRFEL
jgi:hypothetical protein